MQIRLLAVSTNDKVIRDIICKSGFELVPLLSIWLKITGTTSHNKISTENDVFYNCLYYKTEFAKKNRYISSSFYNNIYILKQ